MPTELDPKVCYRAVLARDPRFDGRFFTAVRTTGIYCRPICPARTPKLENVEFYPSAIAAQQAGYRPCLRCRPESSPELAAWRGTSNTVSRALALIAEGALAGDDADVDALAARVGIGERQLRRLFQKHLGASPIAVAQVRRALFAKKLVHETTMSMAEIALASGFGSVRRFNDTFRCLYGRPPSALRRHGGAETTGGSRLTLTLSYVPPYDWAAMAEYFAARAIPGVEIVQAGTYHRTIEIDGRAGTIAVAAVPRRDVLTATIRFPDLRALPGIVARLRRMFDLDADIGRIATHLRADTQLAPLVAARPGLRVPGAWDGFELAVRALLGQQITVVAARKLAGKLVAEHGAPLPEGATRELPPALAASARLFPRPARLATCDFSRLGVPAARAAAIAALARAAADDPSVLEPPRDVDRAIARLTQLRGVGEWTAHYIAMRALREPDAFPAADVGLLRATADAGGARPSPAALLARAEAWRPWRAYAAQHLWRAGAW